MDTREAFLVDAFTEEPTCGNPAGVVPEAAGLDGGQRQAIANELGASETAFLEDDPEADRRIQYFTPETEVDLCGHATIASHALLFDRGDIDAGKHTLRTNVGTLTIEIGEGGDVWMTQDEPTVHTADVEIERVAEALGLPLEAITDVDLPVAYASTGLPFLIVPVEYFEHLSDVEPAMDAIEALSEAVDAAGMYAFTFDTLERESTLHGRMFAPLAGVPEDPVTGTASGAAGAYLDHHGAVENTAAMLFEQGHFLDRPGYVNVSIGNEVRVGGHAVTTFEGEIRIPESEGEDIIEA